MTDAPNPVDGVKQFKGGVTVKLRGLVNYRTVPSVRQTLVQQTEGQPDRLVVDMSQVSAMDSSGLAAMVEAMQAQSRHGGRMILAAMPEPVLGVFQIARLDTIFQFAASVDQAEADDAQH